MSLSREFRSQVFAHVNRTGNRIVGNSAREYEADRVASTAFGARATQLYLFSLNRAEHFSNREISLVRALDPVSFLLDEQCVFAAAAEELYFHVPAPAEITCGRLQLGGFGIAFLGKDIVDPFGDDLVFSRLHHPRSNGDGGRSSIETLRAATSSGSKRDPRLITSHILRHFFVGNVQLGWVPTDGQHWAAVGEAI